MSTTGVGALERGYRRNPQRETIALLSEALALNDDQLREFEAVARSGASRRVGGGSRAAESVCDTTRSNLPRPLTSFFGRDDDVASVKDSLKSHRLVTLTGSAGVGKTRLAIHVGEELLDRYLDGVWFADFATISDPELVASVAAQAVGMSQKEERRVDEAIAQWLRRKNVLLIFDNCEHVWEVAAALAHTILTAAQDVRILATSRRRLYVGGETVYRLPSLAVPQESSRLTSDLALRYSAVALFADRAKAADAAFALDDESAPIISKICRRLDGIPLAIELAAARVTVLSIPNLAQRLNERFGLLTSGSRLALPRQQTLLALIDWSFELLEPKEQLFFARLGILAGGFDIDTAASVCAGDALEEPSVLELLVSLVDKSLIVADTTGERERFRLLESTAAYALEKLKALGEYERLARRHAEYFRNQATIADEKYGSDSTIGWVKAAKLELDNYRAALEWTLTRENDAVVGGAIAGALGWLWWQAALGVEGRYWIELALARVGKDDHPAIVASLWMASSLLTNGKRKYEAAQKAVALYEASCNLQGTARARRFIGWSLYHMGRFDEAREEIDRAAGASLSCGDESSAAYCLLLMGLIEMSRGDFATGRTLFNQGIAKLNALGDELGSSIALGNMAELEFASDDPMQALRYANQALAIVATGRTLALTAMWHANSAIYRVAVGDLAGATESARSAVELAQPEQDNLSVATALQHLALLASLAGDKRRAAQVLGYVNKQYDRFGITRGHTEQWGYTKLVTALREELMDDEIAERAIEGGSWTEDRAVEEALKEQ